MTIYMRLCVLCSSSSLDLHRISTLAGEILPEINYTISYDPSESNSGIRARLWKVKRIKKISQILLQIREIDRQTILKEEKNFKLLHVLALLKMASCVDSSDEREPSCLKFAR
jgi:hypothetical protein